MATHRRFTDDFKRDVLKRAAEPGTNKSALAKSLEISGTLLHRWIREASASPDGTLPERKKPGRPRKDASEGEGAASSAGNNAQAQGGQGDKKPGRPRKDAAQNTGAQANQERKRPGRPRKDAAEGQAPAAKRPGRPRREGTQTASAGGGKGKGIDLSAQIEQVNAERMSLKKALSRFMSTNA